MTIEDGIVQPDIEEDGGVTSEGLPGTEQAGSTPEDDAEAIAFFEGMGIPVPADLVRPEPEAQEESDPQTAEPAEAEEAEEPAQPGWQGRRQGLKAAHRALQSEHEQVLQFSQALADTLREMQQRIHQAPPQAAYQPPVEVPQEPDIDLFEDPDGAINQRAARLVNKEIGPLRSALAKLLNEREQATMVNAQQAIIQNLTAAREEYTKAEPGYPLRAQAFQRGYIQDLQAMGFTDTQAMEQFKGEVAQIIQTSIRNGVDPIRSLDTFAWRYAPTQASAQQPRQRTASDRIVAAAAAAAAGAVRPGPDPSGGDIEGSEVSVDALRAGGIKPGAIREMLRSRGGRGKFFDVMKQAEEAEMRARR